MAYNDSGELSPNESYQLGNYTFELRSNYDGDEEVTGIVARMTYNGETKIGGIDIDGQVTVESWSIEANETEASVYVKLQQRVPSVPYSAINSASSGGGTIHGMPYSLQFSSGTGLLTHTPNNLRGVFASKSSGAVVQASGSIGVTIALNSSVTYIGKTAFYASTTASGSIASQTVYPMSSNLLDKYTAAEVAWTMLYGSEVVHSETVLVGRFEINLSTAGGGPDGDWDEPGNTGEPSKTLYVNVTGASSGSCTGTPMNNGMMKDYGCGGDGGYGGGGGAGASTVIIYDFATDKAGSVNQEAIVRGPGAGGPGGKGGWGGNGCILIFY